MPSRRITYVSDIPVSDAGGLHVNVTSPLVCKDATRFVGAAGSIWLLVVVSGGLDPPPKPTLAPFHVVGGEFVLVPPCVFTGVVNGFMSSVFKPDVIPACPTAPVPPCPPLPIPAPPPSAPPLPPSAVTAALPDMVIFPDAPLVLVAPQAELLAPAPPIPAPPPAPLFDEVFPPLAVTVPPLIVILPPAPLVPVPPL